MKKIDLKGELFKKRVSGVFGIASYMSNWNADFTSRPRTVGNGTIYASGESAKHGMRKYWLSNDLAVFYYKSMKMKGDELLPCNISERFAATTGIEIVKETKTKDIMENLMQFYDVMNFGATFAVNNNNLSISGAAQITDGFNIYSDTEIISKELLSPFQNSNKEGAKSATIGGKHVTDEAHYCYSFILNPYEYEQYKIFDGFIGYTNDAFNYFKLACLNCASDLYSTTKAGCENEYAVFVYQKEGSKHKITNLHRYVKYEKEAKFDVLGTLDLSSMISHVETYEKAIEKIEIYIDKDTIELLPFNTTMNCEIFNSLLLG